MVDFGAMEPSTLHFLIMVFVGLCCGQPFLSNPKSLKNENGNLSPSPLYYINYTFCVKGNPVLANTKMFRSIQIHLQN